MFQSLSILTGRAGASHPGGGGRGNRLGPSLKISCNVSATQLRQPSFIKEALSAVRKYGLGPGEIRLEVTESAMADEKAFSTIVELGRMGFHLEIDDFGTGYSALLYLKRVPATVLKVDRSFVGGLPDNREDAEIVKLIVSPSRGLGLRVVAEGVESYESLVFLVGLGVDEVQGYHFARPMPFDRFVEYLRRYKPNSFFWSKDR